MTTTTTAPSIFKLIAIDQNHSLSLALPRLDDVLPHFLLPRLDEGLAGDERLLESLRLQGTTNVVRSDRADSKGKGRGDLAGTDSTVEEQTAERALWDRVADAEAGAQNTRETFKPLRTWDTLTASQAQANSPKLPSETSTFTYEALLSVNESPVILPTLAANLPPKGVDSKALLNLMIRSTLGTTTTDHLKWDDRLNRYLWAGQRRALGISGETTISSIDQFLRIATMVRRLELTITDLSTRPSTSTHHAMLHALSTYLTFVKDRLSTAAEISVKEQTAGWTKWSSALREMEDLTSAMCEVISWPIETAQPLPLSLRASSLLSHIHGQLLSHMTTSQTSPCSLALAFILSLSSRPILRLLHQWVGLADSGDLELDSSDDYQPWADLGITRLPTSSRRDTWVYEFSSRKMPGLIPKEIRKTLFEAGKSLRMLREASGGQHPLCSGQWGFEPEWKWGEERDSGSGATLRGHLRRVEREVEYWRKSHNSTMSKSGLMASIRRTPRKERKRIPPDFLYQTTTSAGPTAQDHVGDEGTGLIQGETLLNLFQLFDGEPGSHIDKTKSNPLWAPTPLDQLQSFLSQYTTPGNSLLPPETPTLQLFITDRLLAPLLAHAKIVSTCLVSLYLDDLDLLDHLDVLRAYFLGGDINFSERVTAALFGRDEAGAGEALGAGKRARTRARLGFAAGGQAVKAREEVVGEWGIGLGLGLSERARWPPGGAELAYALRTTLLGDDREDQTRGKVWEEVEERVSFAVRDLPEDDASGKRARWMNPQAIEALDFLYLSYSPPPAIAHLLAKPLMEKYQSVHNLLLRISRVQLVLRTIFLDTTHVINSTHVSKTGVDDRSRPPSRSSQFGSDDIFRHGTRLGNLVHSLRFRMSGFMDVVGRYVIDRAIGSHWDVMRRRLWKLRRKSTTDSSSRPATPSSPDEEDEYLVEIDDDVSDGEENPTKTGPAPIRLHSIHSLVAYHHLTLDKILRATLQSPSAGQQVTFKVMMSMFGLILDLGKLIKLIQRGMVGDGGERLLAIKKDWDEREDVFMHALERLSVRTGMKEEATREDSHVDLKAQEEDLRLLLLGDKEDGEDFGGEAKGDQDLQELFLRLRLRSTGIKRTGRYAASEVV